MSTIALGIDPDTKSTGWALVERRQSDTKILGVGLVRAKGRLAVDRVAGMASELRRTMTVPRLGLIRSPDMVVIEWMHLRPTHKEKNPNAILSVQAIAGMCVSATLDLQPTHLFTPTPPEWKKSMKKSSKHHAILRNLGLDEELKENGVFIPGAEKLPASMRTHVVDALGLAVWGLDPYGPLFQLELAAKVKARKR